MRFYNAAVHVPDDDRTMTNTPVVPVEALARWLKKQGSDLALAVEHQLVEYVGVKQDQAQVQGHCPGCHSTTRSIRGRIALGTMQSRTCDHGWHDE